MFVCSDKSGKKKEDSAKEEGPRTERTVDEIINALRSQSRAGQYVYALDILVFGELWLNVILY